MNHEAILPSAVSVLTGLIVLLGLGVDIGGQGIAQAQTPQNAPSENDRRIADNARRMTSEIGRAHV